MCLIGDSSPIVNRLTLLTMRCQLSNMRITVSGLKGHNIILEAVKQLVFISCCRHANALKKLLITDCSINDVTS